MLWQGVLSHFFLLVCIEPIYYFTVSWVQRITNNNNPHHQPPTSFQSTICFINVKKNPKQIKTLHHNTTCVSIPPQPVYSSETRVEGATTGQQQQQQLLPCSRSCGSYQDSPFFSNSSSKIMSVNILQPRGKRRLHLTETWHTGVCVCVSLAAWSSPPPTAVCRGK